MSAGKTLQHSKNLSAWSNRVNRSCLLSPKHGNLMLQIGLGAPSDSDSCLTQPPSPMESPHISQHMTFARAVGVGMAQAAPGRSETRTVRGVRPWDFDLMPRPNTSGAVLVLAGQPADGIKKCAPKSILSQWNQSSTCALCS